MEANQLPLRWWSEHAGRITKWLSALLRIIATIEAEREVGRGERRDGERVNSVGSVLL
jgi:hypothetical protein